jgi:hypothetical protein
MKNKTKPNDPIEWRHYTPTMTSKDGTFYEDHNAGLTKREYFAGLAMQGMLANSYSNDFIQTLSQANRYDIAELAVEQADALIELLNKKMGE